MNVCRGPRYNRGCLSGHLNSPLDWAVYQANKKGLGGSRSIRTNDSRYSTAWQISPLTLRGHYLTPPIQTVSTTCR